MKLSARKIVLLILSILVLGFVVYSVISLILQIPELREMVLTMFSDPKISSVIPDPENVVNLVLGISIFSACSGGVLYIVAGIFGLLAALGKYRGGAHVVIMWICLIFNCLGLLSTVIGLFGGAEFDASIILSIIEVAVSIAFIIIAKQIKEDCN